MRVAVTAALLHHSAALLVTTVRTRAAVCINGVVAMLRAVQIAASAVNACAAVRSGFVGAWQTVSVVNACAAVRSGFVGAWQIASAVNACAAGRGGFVGRHRR